VPRRRVTLTWFFLITFWVGGLLVLTALRGHWPESWVSTASVLEWFGWYLVLSGIAAWPISKHKPRRRSANPIERFIARRFGTYGNFSFGILLGLAMMRDLATRGAVPPGSVSEAAQKLETAIFATLAVPAAILLLAACIYHSIKWQKQRSS
jgi:hypothetical protein